MTLKFLPATLLGAVAAFVLNIGVAFANSDGGLSAATGYVYPNYWGQAPARQHATVPHQAEIKLLDTNTTDRSGDISLYPPNPWG
jgi:hypothetical protein